RSFSRFYVLKFNNLKQLIVVFDTQSVFNISCSCHFLFFDSLFSFSKVAKIILFSKNEYFTYIPLTINHMGILTLKVVPDPGWDSVTATFPLWYSSTIRFTRVRPSPHPLFLVVYPGLKILRICFGVIPLPVSFISICAHSGEVVKVMVSFPFPSIASM